MSATVAQKVEPMMVSTTLGTPLIVEPEPAKNYSNGDTESPSVGRKKAQVKKVTFDLDLEIHTIPQRIPLYEKRPASHLSYPTRGQHPQAFLPRPLDLRGRDKHLLGATSTKKIIDLFNLSNHNYPFSPKVIGRSSKRSLQSTGAFRSTFPPTNSYTVRKPMSRAAFNLKEITNALGDLDDSFFDYTQRARNQIGGSTASMASVLPDEETYTKTNVTDIQSRTRKPNRDGNSTIGAFSPSKIKTSPHRTQEAQQTLTIDTPPLTEQQNPPYSISTTSPHIKSVSVPLKSVPHQLKNRRHFKTTKSRTIPQTEITPQRSPSPSKDTRTSSRCSTIETYVIADGSDKQRVNRSSARSGSASSYRRRLVSPSKKTTISHVAWGSSGTDNTSGSYATSPRMGHLAQHSMGPVQPQWEVLARPAKLSASGN